MKLSSLVLCSVLVLAAGATRAQAQEKPAARPLVPLEIEVVISRYEGAKRISNFPYTLAVNSDSVNVQLNMGTQVAVPSTAFTPTATAEQKTAPLISFSYRDVGTKIQASAAALDDGRFQVQLSIDDTSVFANPTQVGGSMQPMPAFRTFSSRNTLLLRDGQMREYTAATDRVSGEVVKVSVTLRVVK